MLGLNLILQSVGAHLWCFLPGGKFQCPFMFWCWLRTQGDGRELVLHDEVKWWQLICLLKHQHCSWIRVLITLQLKQYPPAIMSLTLSFIMHSTFFSIFIYIYCRKGSDVLIYLIPILAKSLPWCCSITSAHWCYVVLLDNLHHWLHGERLLIEHSNILG